MITFATCNLLYIQNMNNHEYTNDAVALLRRLIQTPSVSRTETAAADIMQQEMERCGLKPQRDANNVWAIGDSYNPSRPTLLPNIDVAIVGEPTGMQPAVAEKGLMV